MSRKLGVSSQLYNNYEKGVHNPKVEFYIKWKNLFNQDLMSINIDRKDYSPAEEENNIVAEHSYSRNEEALLTLSRIIEKQQETIHYLTTGKDQGGLSKKASG